MKILVVDEVSKRRAQVVDALEKNRHTVKGCSSSGDFMAAMGDWKPEQLLLDVETWKKGRSMYNYFQFTRKLEKTPILFYNAEEGYSVDGFRSSAERDHILPKPTKVEQIVSTLEQAP